VATERLVIEVPQRGAKVVSGSIKGIAAASDQATRSLGFLEKALGTAFVAAAAKQGVDVIRSFEQELSTVAAVTGAVGDEFDALRERAQELGATTRFTATDAAASMVELGRAGFSVGESLESVDDVLTLAQSGAIDLATAAGITSSALRGMRLDTAEAGRVVDVFTDAANASNTDVLQLGDAFRYVAPIAAGLNVSLEETTAALGTLSDAGLQGSMAGTGLRRVLSELESPSEKTAKLLGQLGLRGEDVRVSQVGLVEAMTRLRDAGVDTGIALEIFGDRGGPAFEVLSNAIPRVVELTGRLENAAGVSLRVAQVMDDNLNGAFLALQSAAEAVVLAIAEVGASDSLERFIRGAADALRFVADNIDDFIRALTAGGGLFAVLALMRVNVTAALTPIVKFALANPFTLIAAGAAAAAAALAFFADEIVVGERGLTTLQDVFDETFEVAGDIVEEFANTWARGFQFMAEEAAGGVRQAAFSFKTLALGAAQTADDVANFLTGIVLVIKEIPSAIRNALQGKSLVEFLFDPSVTFEVGARAGRQLADVFATAFTGSTAVDAVTEILAGADARALRRRFEAGKAGGIAGGTPDAPLPEPSDVAAAATSSSAATEAAIAELERVNRLLGLGNLERERAQALHEILLDLQEKEALVTPEQEERIAQLIRQNQALEIQGQYIASLIPDYELLNLQLEALEKAYNDGAISARTFAEEARKIKLAEKPLTDLEQLARDTFFSFQDSLSSALLGGEDAFRRFAETALEQLNRIAITEAFYAAIPGLDSSRIFGRQFGGPFAPGDRAIVGEDGPEVVTFGQRGRVDPLPPLQSAGPKFNIINVTDPREIPAVIAAGRADRAVVNTVGRNAMLTRAALGKQGV